MTKKRRHLQARPTGDNAYEKATFRKLFESVAWKRMLEDLLPELPLSAQSSPGPGPIVYFTQDGDADEETIMSRFRDGLLSEEPQSIPLPGLLLSEYLDSFGALDVSFWQALPCRAIGRVIEGEIPISASVSEQLSCAFGTRSGFWRDLQVEYDRRFRRSSL